MKISNQTAGLLTYLSPAIIFEMVANGLAQINFVGLRCFPFLKPVKEGLVGFGGRGYGRF